MKKNLETEVKVGLFVALGLGLVMLSILVLGSTENLLTRKARFHTHFPSVEGLISGAKVVLGGLQVGTVDRIDFDMDKRDIKVEFSVVKNATNWIRQDSAVEIATQGVLGDKYVSITAGSADQPLLAPGTEIPNRPSKGLTQFISKGDQLMVNLNSLTGSLDRLIRTFEANNRSEVFFQGLATTSKNLSIASEKLTREIDDLRLKKITKNLDGILEKINNGTGTLGALVNDPGLYDDAKRLVGEANRNRIVRNLVRQTIKSSDEQAAEAEKKKK